jgi:hypothetical protein
MRHIAWRGIGGRCARSAVATAAVVAALIPGARELGAQVRGTVSSTAGRPLATVLVELWRGSAQMASRVTDSTGRFRFTRAEANGATELSARRIGFAAKRVLLTRRDTLLDLRLSGMVDAPTTDALSRIASACPNHEQSEARSLWQLVRRRYRSADSVLLATTFSVSTSVVGTAELGTTIGVPEPKGERALPGASRVRWRRRIAEEGYAWMLEYRGDGYLSKMWEYPPLESDFVQHFVDHVFGRMHRLSLETSNDGEMVIAFCAAEARFPALSGLLILSADSSLARAVWRLRSPEPTEESGGEVVFAPASRSRGTPILLPRRGLFWRRLPSGEFHQRWQFYDEWKVGEGEGAVAEGEQGQSRR